MTWTLIIVCCRWIHMDSFCEWEWKDPHLGVRMIGCDMTDDRTKINLMEDSEYDQLDSILSKVWVDQVGDYDKFQCAITFLARSRHKGSWVCEIEKYHVGFGRRYGEVRTREMMLTISRDR